MAPLTIVAGTRPEVIKLAPVYVAARRRFGEDGVRWVSTGQHRALEDETLRTFGIRTAHCLDAGDVQGSLIAVTSRILERLSPLLIHEAPAAVIVQGDTISAFAGAFAAFHARIPVVHVEAGLRTYDNFDPYPEEAYRRMIDALATVHLAPTAAAAAHLFAEGCGKNSVYVTGNTAVDALALIDGAAARAMDSAALPNFPPGTRPLFVTLHRRESWGSRLREMCLAIRDIADRFDDVRVVFPVHVNPVVRNQVAPLLDDHPRIRLLDPLDYASCHVLIRRAHLILTDSGGIQEEAPSYGVPVLVLRERTERPEGIVDGTAVLVGTDRARIVDEATRLLSCPARRASFRDHPNPFGDGRAAERIVIAIERFMRGETTLLRDDEQFVPAMPVAAL